jgi:hypothetical protein
MDGGHPTNRSINRTYQHISTTSNYSSTTTTQHQYNRSSENSKSSKLLKQVPRGPAPFASFDSIASIDVTTPEDRNIPAYQGSTDPKEESPANTQIFSCGYIPRHLEGRYSHYSRQKDTSNTRCDT